jgi:hypothetical protein
VNSAIWTFQTNLTNRLLAWSILSILAGLYLCFSPNDFGRGFGIQCVVWGFVDAGIALFGARSAARRKSTADPKDEAVFIQRLLWINFGLDFLYIFIGVSILHFLPALFWQGTGWGIIIQGGFLLFFDLIHALRVPIEVT